MCVRATVLNTASPLVPALSPSSSSSSPQNSWFPRLITHMLSSSSSASLRRPTRRRSSCFFYSNMEPNVSGDEENHVTAFLDQRRKILTRTGTAAGRMGERAHRTRPPSATTASTHTCLHKTTPSGAICVDLPVFSPVLLSRVHRLRSRSSFRTGPDGSELFCQPICTLGIFFPFRPSCRAFAHTHAHALKRARQLHENRRTVGWWGED